MGSTLTGSRSICGPGAARCVRRKCHGSPRRCTIRRLGADMKAWDEMTVGEKARIVGNMILAGRPVDAARLEIVGVMRAMASALDQAEAEFHRAAVVFGADDRIPRRGGPSIVASDACKWQARL